MEGSRAIVATTGESAGQCAEDQRRWQRTANPKTVQIHPLVDGRPARPIATRIKNFSEMGLGLVHSRRMDRGEQFVISLGTTAGADVPLLYSVVHCRGLKNGLFAIGAELMQVLDAERFTAMTVGDAQDLVLSRT